MLFKLLVLTAGLLVLLASLGSASATTSKFLRANEIQEAAPPVAATPLVLARALQTEEEEEDHDHEMEGANHTDTHLEEDHPNSWCHCEGASELHCLTDKVAAESFCECHDHEGELEVECQAVDSSCHCEGEEVHCDIESAEALATATCQCHEGSLECIGDEHEEKEGANHTDTHHEEGEAEGPNSWCTCNESSELTCLTDKVAAESFCECHEHDGELEVECQEVDSSCHCHGTEVHCSDESAQALAAAICECHEGSMECIGAEEHDHDDESEGNEVGSTVQTGGPNSWCHCDGPSELHCSTDKVAAESFCECHEHDGAYEVECQEVDSSCHCDGTDIHCSSESDEELAAATCQCQDGELQCIGVAESQEEETSDESKPWGAAIGFALLVNVATFTGLIILIPTLVAPTLCASPKYRMSTATKHFIFNTIIPSFACGALLATTVFLLLPEAILLIGGATGLIEGHGDHEGHNHRALQEEDAHDSAETQLAWKFGTSLLGGYLIPVILASIFPHNHEAEEELQYPDDFEESTKGGVESAIPVDRSEMSTVAEGTSGFCDKVGCSSLHTTHPEEEENDDSSDGAEVWDSEVFTVKDSKQADDAVNPVKPPTSSKANVNDVSSTTQSPAVASSPSIDKKDSTSNKTISMSRRVSRRFSLDSTSTKKAIDWQLATSILVGDAFHNFADGVFIGTAFSVCSNAVAYAIVAATIYHELAQELADYFILTTHVGFTPWVALGLNFVSGLSIVLGAVLILALDITQMATGCILAISAGVYVYISASEIAPRLEKQISGWKDRAVSILCFALGAIPIGLVLLSHGHCSA